MVDINGVELDLKAEDKDKAIEYAKKIIDYTDAQIPNSQEAEIGAAIGAVVGTGVCAALGVNSPMCAKGGALLGKLIAGPIKSLFSKNKKTGCNSNDPDANFVCNSQGFGTGDSSRCCEATKKWGAKLIRDTGELVICLKQKPGNNLYNFIDFTNYAGNIQVQVQANKQVYYTVSAWNGIERKANEAFPSALLDIIESGVKSKKEFEDCFKSHPLALVAVVAFETGVRTPDGLDKFVEQWDLTNEEILDKLLNGDLAKKEMSNSKDNSTKLYISIVLIVISAFLIIYGIYLKNEK